MGRGHHFIFNLALAAAFVLFAMASSSAEDPYLRTISHLLQYVERSGCTFIRNDREYTSGEAAKHLKTKLESVIGRITTPEDFIASIASRSSVSGRPYWVRCADRRPTPSAEWLTDELSAYRQAVRTKP